MLEIEQLHAYYGKSHVLHDVNLHIARGEIVALLGRNGAGRSTLAKAIMGMVAWSGSMRFQGQSLAGKKTFELAQMGLGYVPESRDVFGQLTVQQNLLLGEKHPRQASRWGLADMYRMFPRLHERMHTPAGVLSGGEQQMLSLSRTLMGNPTLIVIDEPTEGLAPQIIEQVAHYLRELRAAGVSVLLIEQKLSMTLNIADRLLVMGHGSIVFEGTAGELRAQPAIQQEWLQV